MKLKDHVPLKVVAEDLGMSRTSLWRASKSNIAGFPAPVVIRRLVYWRKADLPALEEALMRYRGRVAFEKGREATRRITMLKRAKAAAEQQRPKLRAIDRSNPDLFGE